MTFFYIFLRYRHCNDAILNMVVESICNVTDVFRTCSEKNKSAIDVNM